MAIHFQTGVPGAGKTAYTIWHVKARAEAENREVFYAGIPDLKLPWTSLNEGVRVNGFWTYDIEGRAVWNASDELKIVKGVDQWMHLPPGAIIVIDECQDYFRNRSRSAVVPPFVQELEKHRHRGHDLYLITQKPGLVDPSVKDLAGKHIHLARQWMGTKVRVFEWETAKDITKANLKDALCSKFAYPPEVFTWYKSTEVDTHKAKKPLHVRLLPVYFGLAVLFAVAAVYKIYGWTDKGVGGSAAAAPAASTPTIKSGEKAVVTKAEYVASWKPRVDGLPHTAPAYDEVTKVQIPPLPVACVASANRCLCFSQQGTKMDVPGSLCRSIVANGFFNPYEGSKRDSEGRTGGASAPRTAPEEIASPARAGGSHKEMIGSFSRS